MNLQALRAQLTATRGRIEASIADVEQAASAWAAADTDGESAPEDGYPRRSWLV